jgi:phage terminase small subunit
MRKTDDREILRLLNEKVSQKDIAIRQGVSPAAICKRVKILANKLPRSFAKLSQKEQKFALSILEGKSQASAAVNSFNVSSSDSAKAIGCQLMKKPSVTMAIKDLMDFHGLDKSYRIAKIKEHVDNLDPNVSLKSLDMSFKLDGSYTEKHIHVHTSYQDMVKAQEIAQKRIKAFEEKYGITFESETIEGEIIEED